MDSELLVDSRLMLGEVSTEMGYCDAKQRRKTSKGQKRKKSSAKR